MFKFMNNFEVETEVGIHLSWETMELCLMTQFVVVIVMVIFLGQFYSRGISVKRVTLSLFEAPTHETRPYYNTILNYVPFSF